MTARNPTARPFSMPATIRATPTAAIAAPASHSELTSARRPSPSSSPASVSLVAMCRIVPHCSSSRRSARDEMALVRSTAL